MALIDGRPVVFPSRDRSTILLEGLLHVPQGTQRPAPFPTIILCHPQPASSSMNDELLATLASDLANNGFLALRFNFRGVGRSQGEQSDGRFEPLDVAGAVEFAAQQRECRREKMALIGHAFGAYVALTYAPFDPRIRTVVAISLPLFRLSKGFAEKYERPKLFVTGELDEVCPRHKLEPFVGGLPGGKGLKIITGARHLMRGYEREASGTILTYLKRWSESPGV